MFCRTAPMWAEVFLLVALGWSVSGTPIDVDELDCAMRRLMLDQARTAQPWRAHLAREVFDSLRLDALCGDTPPTTTTTTTITTSSLPTDSRLFYVSPNASSGNGNIETPFSTVHEALNKSREFPGEKRAIVLRGGVHLLSETLAFGAGDAGSTLMSYPGEEAWLSGGQVIPRTAPWKKGVDGSYSVTLNDSISEVLGLFTLDTHRRLTRARFPNADAETAQWGYASTDRLTYAIDSSMVDHWWKPPVHPIPAFTYTDLSSTNPSGHIKNDSDMPEYNTYGYGVGGVCNTVWEKDTPSYWCGNNSAGGWAEVDQQAVKAGQLNLPIGMTFTDDPRLRRFALWENATGAIVHAWHSQSWFTNMFEVGTQNKTEHSLTFTRGGQQGGRNWCRCDQCSYAAPWCGQHQQPPQNNDTRLISGGWFVENVLEELDAKTEWYFAPDSHTLHLKPNGSISAEDLVVPLLRRLVSIVNTTDITIEGIGFRDAQYTFMDDWAAPSGGDWAIHRGGAVFIENAASVSIANCTFKRLDGNALFLSRKTRNVTIDSNEFVWIGDSAMATWGDTDGYDATSGAQPRGTMVRNNYIHEIGIYEKQSSAWGQNKACQTTFENNILFNMPRAAINLNDALGGDNAFVKNLIWNTCRESGDHGPINTWDRMPFLTDIATPGTPSFTPAPTRIEQNFIFANYGGAQGVDNDDGSSFFHISGNVFYAADGFKMDYGGHDSLFTNNLVVTFPYDGQNCMNVGPFKKGHGDTYKDNKCIIGVGAKTVPSGCGDPSCAGPVSTDLYHVTSQNQCDESIVHTGGNKFFTPNGTAIVTCGGESMTLEEAQVKYSIQPGSTAAEYPLVEEIVLWAKELVM